MHRASDLLYPTKTKPAAETGNRGNQAANEKLTCSLHGRIWSSTSAGCVRQPKQLQANQTDGRQVPGKLYSQGWKTLSTTKKRFKKISRQTTAKQEKSPPSG
ncbi:MAG: hypothetical protein CMJ81_09870 [Planctomycetaceae bacterium]|nr:hypothetical protein [Planctomycetaceae bacterium]MBP61650.1 hypothetical protein [Planctomycetaceae bacterium]